MQTSELGKAEIKRHEGLRLRTYDDGVGNRTIGYGHLIRSDMPNQITREEAERLFLADLATAEEAVNRFVQVPLTSSQFDALVSLVFNWGAGNFAQSELLRRLNAYDYAGAQARLREHPITAGGQVMSGLQRRRRAEADWFEREGIYTREELAAMGFTGRNISGTPEPSTPTEPTPGADQPTPGTPGTAGTQAGGGLGNWLWLLIGGALLAFVVLSSDD